MRNYPTLLENAVTVGDSLILDLLVQGLSGNDESKREMVTIDNLLKLASNAVMSIDISTLKMLLDCLQLAPTAKTKLLTQFYSEFMVEKIHNILNTKQFRFITELLEIGAFVDADESCSHLNIAIQADDSRLLALLLQKRS